MDLRFQSSVSRQALCSKGQDLRICGVVFLWIGILFSSSVLLAQSTSLSAAPADQQTMQILLERIEKLEARVAQLEAASQRSTSPSTTAAVSTPEAQEPAVTAPPSETPMSERMDVSKTLLRMRGFGDVNLHGSNQKGDTTSFSLGQLNLFVTSDVSEKFKFLSEIVFEAGPDNIYGTTRGEANSFSVDLERLLLQYSHNDYFNLAVGRYHTAIGFYNTAYHHSTWFQTTEERPFIFEFEDRGGILPIHNVGASLSGLIPSGGLGLHYVAEVGNGRESRSPLQEEPVQNTVDEANHKAFNFAFFSRPEAVHGLQAGFSVYHDLLSPAALGNVPETILAAHAVLIRPHFEWLNEALVIRHSPQALHHTFETPAFYTQVSRQFGAYRPYFRYEYVNASNREPIFPDIGLRQGPSVGVRYDASEFVAVKLQYDHTSLRQQPGIDSLGLQVGFTF